MVASFFTRFTRPKPLTEVEKSVIISALNDQITSDQLTAVTTPGVRGYVDRNVAFREGLIQKLESL